MIQPGGHQQDPRTALMDGSAALRGGNPAQALACFDRCLALAPGQGDALHLRAIALRRLNRLTEAEAAFRAALAARPGDGEILNNQGNLYLAQGALSRASACFEAATKARPRLADAWYNWGLALQRADDHAAALDRFDRAIAIKGDDPRFHTARGVSLREGGRLDDAAGAYEQALRIKPDHVKALQNLGVVKRQQDDPARATALLQQAARLAPRQVEVRYNLANALHDAGDIEGADREYRTAIAIDPTYLPAHEVLNKMYWERGRKELFARSFEVARQQAPDHEGLAVAHVAALERAARPDDAARALDAALAAVGPTANLLRRQARLLADRGEAAAAQDIFARAVHQTPDDRDLRMDAAQLSLQMGDLGRAHDHLDRVEAMLPEDQEMWAFRGLAWQIAGDARADWLFDTDRFVAAYDITPPEGYESLEALMADVRAALDAMHTTMDNPLDQTLRGGTQTHGRLFTRPVPVIQALAGAIGRAVQSYMDAMPRDDSHPLLRRNTGRFRYSGSWSVRLSPGGYHFNHVHPEGWISSAFYVTVPEPGAGEADKAGWIKFGESNLVLGPEREMIRRWEKPQEGRLVLFPSYLWHGTQRYDSGGPRMTAPFDAVPDQR
ncbi:tetratricopeptide repeat protein [Yunchengibacter salinarum]|uniref:tetratricopeptide repeat protein n=1 Tax=Yunchengibacter salinarum TaxID=3133399 RepID=UPI0035B633FC